MSENFNETVYVKGEKEGFHLNSISISTTNDNGISPTGKEFGDDTGKTFSFENELSFNMGDDKYKVEGNFNHYTTGEKFVYDENGVRDWGATDFSDSTRIDQVDIGVKKEVLNYQNEKGDNYSVNIGLGGQAIGNVGGENIQKEWHKANDFYEHKAEYEDISGATIDVRGDASGKKYILGDENIGTYVNGSADFKIAANNRYGESSVGGEVGVGINGMGLKIEGGYHGKIVDGVTASSTIHNSLDNESGSYVKASAPVPFVDGLNVEYKYEKNNDGNDYINLKVRYEF